VVRVRVRPQRAGSGNSGTASAIIRSTICAAVGTSAMSATPQPAYIAMAAAGPPARTAATRPLWRCLSPA